MFSKTYENKNMILQRNGYVLAQVIGILSGDVVLHLKILVDLVCQVWISNLQIYSIVLELQTYTAVPGIRHTWYQEPVKFEDALGRLLPIPFEYDYAMLSQLSLKNDSKPAAALI